VLIDPSARFDAYSSFARGSPENFASGKPVFLFLIFVRPFPISCCEAGTQLVCESERYVMCDLLISTLKVQHERSMPHGRSISKAYS